MFEIYYNPNLDEVWIQMGNDLVRDVDNVRMIIKLKYYAEACRNFFYIGMT